MGPDLAAIGIGGKIPYSHIIRLRQYTTNDEFTRHRGRLTDLCAGKTVSEYGVPCGPESEHHIYNIGKFKGYCGYFTEEIINELRTWDEVDKIKPNIVCGIPPGEERMELLGGGSSGGSNVGSSVGYRPPKELAESVIDHASRRTDADADADALPGAGVDIYVIDSGIRTSHRLFGGRASFGINLVDDVDQDVNGHGTQVAGVAGADLLGVAKGANLIAVKVYGRNGLRGQGTVIGGIAWSCLKAMTKLRPAVFVLSIGGTADDFLDDVVANVFDVGYLCCVAAGNGPLGSKFGTPGIDAGVISPAREPKAFTVGAAQWDKRAPYRCEWSNFGPCLALFALGDDVTTCGHEDDDDRGGVSGTSFACPRAAGVAAVLLSIIPAHKNNPQQLTNDIRAQAYDNMIVATTGANSPNLFL